MTTSNDDRLWIIQVAVPKGNFLNLEHYIKTGKRGNAVDVIWEILKGAYRSVIKFIFPPSIAPLEEAVEWVQEIRSGRVKRSRRYLDDKRLYNVRTGEFIPCTALII